MTGILKKKSTHEVGLKQKNLRCLLALVGDASTLVTAVAGIDFDFITAALVDKNGLLVLGHAGELNLETELGAGSTVVGCACAPG